MENKTAQDHDWVSEWLASTGFLFPENEIEYGRFKKLFPSSASFAGVGIYVDDIINGKPYSKRTFKIPQISLDAPQLEYKLVAAIKMDSNSSAKKNIPKNKGKK